MNVCFCVAGVLWHVARPHLPCGRLIPHQLPHGDVRPDEKKTSRRGGRDQGVRAVPRGGLLLRKVIHRQVMLLSLLGLPYFILLIHCWKQAATLETLYHTILQVFGKVHGRWLLRILEKFLVFVSSCFLPKLSETSYHALVGMVISLTLSGLFIILTKEKSVEFVTFYCCC